jgi:four helix bundle protein
VGLIRSFRDLDVYKESVQEAQRIFVLTKKFPREEIYSLTGQIRRASRAVGSMLAEAWGRRRYPAAFVSKLTEALAECMETQSWLDHSLACEYITPAEHDSFDIQWQQIGAKLNRMIARADDFCKSASK